VFVYTQLGFDACAQSFKELILQQHLAYSACVWHASF
jgi:hypothetical protein